MNNEKNEMVPRLRFPGFEKNGEWQIEMLGNIIKNRSSTLSQNRIIFTKSGYAIYGADGLIGFADFYDQEEDYIAIIKDGSGVGKLFFYKKKSSILSTLSYLMSQDNNLHYLTFLFYLLQTLNLSSYINGGGIPHIYYSEYAKKNVLIPMLSEQQKIAACLSSLDELTAAETESLVQLKVHKKGLMQNLFPTEGEIIPKVRFPEFKAEGEWEEKSMDELLIDGKLGGNYENINFVSGIPVIKMGNLERGRINIEKLQYLPKGVNYFVGDVLQKGDILLNTRNTLDLVGKVAIWNNELPIAIYNSNLLRLSFDEKYVKSNYFMNYILNTENSLSKIRKIATGTTSVAAIYTKDFLRLKVFVPSLYEQQKIADCLSSLDTQITHQTEKIESLKLHKKGLMQQLFPAINES